MPSKEIPVRHDGWGFRAHTVELAGPANRGAQAATVSGCAGAGLSESGEAAPHGETVVSANTFSIAEGHIVAQS